MGLLYYKSNTGLIMSNTDRIDRLERMVEAVSNKLINPKYRELIELTDSLKIEMGELAKENEELREKIKQLQN